MIEAIKTPFIGVNDNECNLTSINAKDGEFLKKDDLVCEVETTKATFDVFAPFDGYIYLVAEINDELKVGDTICLISTTSKEKKIIFQEYSDTILSTKATIDSSITIKAKILLKKHKLSVDDIKYEYPDRKIDEKLINEFLSKTNNYHTRIGLSKDEISKVKTFDNSQNNKNKIGIIGGVSGGGAQIIIDSLINSSDLVPTAIFDSDESFVGSNILGVPIVGSHEAVVEWKKNSRIDLLIIAFNKNLEEREKVYNSFKSMGISFANIIDVKADIRSGLEIGEGNVILGQTYIGPGTKIGNNNFISSNVCLEHGNILGSHCSFGPAVYTSGNVTIGDKIRFGTGIHIEPNINIGNEAIISSGSTIVNHVDMGVVYK